MANIEATIGAEARRRIKEAQDQIVTAQAGIAKWEGILEALGQKVGKAKGKVAGKRKGVAKRDMTAAHDAMAVKRGTATPEQVERFMARQRELVANGAGGAANKANGPISQARAKRAAVGTGGAPGASLQPDPEAESEA